MCRREGGGGREGGREREGREIGGREGGREGGRVNYEPAAAAAGLSLALPQRH